MNWHQEEIQNLVRRTKKKMLTIHGQHDQRAHTLIPYEGD
jgi:hypothetical protein